MLVKQINVFLENQSGRLAEVTRTLGENDIDIRALYIADTTEYGILRMILDKPDKAVEVLTASGFTVSSTPVIAIAIEDKPGTLDHALSIFSEGSLSLEYLYAYVGRTSDEAVVVIRVQDPQMALIKLEESGIRVLSSEEVYGI